MDSLTLIRPDDWHSHLRDGDALRAIVESAVGAIVARDPGGMLLDAHKGPVGPDSVRRRPKKRRLKVTE